MSDATIDFTPTWSVLVLPMLDAFLATSDADARTVIREEFVKMAMAADRYIAIADTPGSIATDMITSEGLRP
jgi:hypothetical protein